MFHGDATPPSRLQHAACAKGHSRCEKCGLTKQRCISLPAKPILRVRLLENSTSLMAAGAGGWISDMRASKVVHQVAGKEVPNLACFDQKWHGRLARGPKGLRTWAGRPYDSTQVTYGAPGRSPNMGGTPMPRGPCPCPGRTSGDDPYFFRSGHSSFIRCNRSRAAMAPAESPEARASDSAFSAVLIASTFRPASA